MFDTPETRWGATKKDGWYGKNGAYWNLINENRQAVMSGIYLFSVQDVDNKKDDFVGELVIIK
ncbi:MAG TPA: hypothetical protein PKW56_01245 [Clostridiales bacterium]|nr:hypothetical protein [Clostridiales bacterium]